MVVVVGAGFFLAIQQQLLFNKKLGIKPQKIFDLRLKEKKIGFGKTIFSSSKLEVVYLLENFVIRFVGSNCRFVSPLVYD
jgi:hypothetical protein